MMDCSYLLKYLHTSFCWGG